MCVCIIGGKAVRRHGRIVVLYEIVTEGLYCSIMTCGWKGLGDGGIFIGSGGGGGLFGSILERGDPKLFRMLLPRFWVGYLVKW